MLRDLATARPSGRHHESAHPIGSQPIPRGEHLDDSPVPTSPIRDITITDNDAHRLGQLHRASTLHRAAPQGVQRALKVLSNVTSDGPNFADIAADVCLQKFPKDLIGMPNSKDGCSCGRQEKFTNSSDESLDSNTRGRSVKEESAQTEEQRGLSQGIDHHGHEGARWWSSWHG